MKTVEIFSTVETDTFWASRSRSRSRSRRDQSRPPTLNLFKYFTYTHKLVLVVLNLVLTSFSYVIPCYSESARLLVAYETCVSAFYYKSNSQCLHLNICHLVDKQLSTFFEELCLLETCDRQYHHLSVRDRRLQHKFYFITFVLNVKENKQKLNEQSIFSTACLHLCPKADVTI